MEAQAPLPPPAEGPADDAWLSEGLEVLLAELAQHGEPPADEPHVDLLIVGSGYGGAVAASQFAGCREGDRPLSVWVIERGLEFLPGDFPARAADLPGEVRFSTPKGLRPRGRREGLFDVRIGEDVCVLQANGLGGGSLINAGVMAWPHPSVFQSSAWPREIREEATLRDWSERLMHPLAARSAQGERNTVVAGESHALRKFEQLRALAGAQPFEPTAITVALQKDTVTAAGVALEKCVDCGDCATGCNHGAKASLDTTLLAQAHRAGARFFTGATVLRLERHGSLWHVLLTHTDEKLRLRQGAAARLRARRVVLSAGALGTTEILLRSGEAARAANARVPLRFSPTLGTRCSTNGDMIAVVPRIPRRVNCAADETAPPAERAVGPTITAMIDLRGGDAQRDMVIQELSVPGPLRRLLQETTALSESLLALSEGDGQHYAMDGVEDDPCALDETAADHALVVAIMGDDGAQGRIELQGGASESCGDGAVKIRWPGLRKAQALDDRQARLDELRRKAGLEHEALANPLWRPASLAMEKVVGRMRGPLLTVHPLGGAPMGDDAAHGTVDHLGRVFDPDAAPGAAPWHEGLVVLDGAMVPGALGINPALSISALSLRAAQGLIDHWGLGRAAASARVQPPRRRGFTRAPERPAPPRATEVQLVEQLEGQVMLREFYRPCRVRVRLNSEPFALRSLFARGGKRRVVIGEGSRLLVDRPEALPGEPAWLDLPLRGELRVFGIESSTLLGRTLRAVPPWLANRGLRDTWQYFSRQLRGTPLEDDGTASTFARARNALATASHAGLVRRLDYTLRIGADDTPAARSLPGADVSQWVGATISGSKRMTYSRRGNPWRQLSQVSLDAFPHLAAGASPPMLELDQDYLADQRVPLLRVTGQQDMPSALFDMGSFLMYAMRVILRVHLWSFRKPDLSLAAEAQQREVESRRAWADRSGEEPKFETKPYRSFELAGPIAGLPEPIVKWIPSDHRDPRARCGPPVFIRLCGYPRPGAPAVLLLHGYSASSATFAHPRLDPNLVRALHDSGRSVWVADLRTSAGLGTAVHAWTFETAACHDIPRAVLWACRLSKCPRVAIVAHCMGSAMLGMALLADADERRARARIDPSKDGELLAPGATGAADEPAWRALLQAQPRAMHPWLPGRIEALVMSQVTPLVRFKPGNRLRAYVMRYLRHVLMSDDYQFHVGEGQKTMRDSMVDRLLMTMPYPVGEFDLENPVWPWRRTPWTATRHRMDALYGQDFELANVDASVLDFIDDHFGPLSIDTVSQAINFARFSVITNAEGRNCYVSPVKLRCRYDFPVLALHGRRNGLTHAQTLELLQEAFRNAREGTSAGRGRLEIKHFESLGHQDCLVGGERSRPVFDYVVDFLDRARVQPPASASPSAAAVVASPADTAVTQEA